ncbi:MAG TPA: hypothetical protein VFU19_03965 [Iamia sp.]|nr:hypothetical protein [Iamia sp.]
MGVALFHLVGGVGAVVTWSVARRTETPTIVRIIVAGWFAKLIGTLARFYVLQVVYDGTGDANRYSRVGAQVATMLRTGELTWHRPGSAVVGTHFVEYVTGSIFTVTGPTTLGGFVVFSAASFVGIYLVFRAVRVLIPGVDERRYALLLFFLPSMVFWPSSIGKEALMILAIGLFALGAARLFLHVRGGVVLLAAGCLLSAAIRPHITLILVAALLLATVIASPTTPATELPIGKLFRVGLAAAVLVWAAASAGSFLEVEPLDRGAVSAALESTADRTDTGGSAFTNVNPVLFPVAAVTVLFRPFPFEAGNVPGLIASAEGMLLLTITFRHRRTILVALKSLRTSPLLAMSFCYIVLFVYAYTGFNNFGLLSRQRCQVYPFVLLVLCCPPRLLARGERQPRPDAHAIPAGSP